MRRRWEDFPRACIAYTLRASWENQTPSFMHADTLVGARKTRRKPLVFMTTTVARDTSAKRHRYGCTFAPDPRCKLVQPPDRECDAVSGASTSFPRDEAECMHNATSRC